MSRPHCPKSHQIAKKALAEKVRTLRRHVRAASAHSVDGIHDLRVASRRLRAVLSDYASNYRKSALRPFRKRVKDITRGLGTARELDVSLGLLRTWRKKLPARCHPAVSALQRHLRKLRNAESPRVDESCTIVRSTGFNDTLDALVASMKHPRKCQLELSERTISKRWRKLHATFDLWQTDSSDANLHEVRIAFKQLRYSCEIAESSYGAPMTQFIAHMKAAQESLGDWNDVRVLQDYVHEAIPLMHKHEAALSEVAAKLDAELLRLLNNFNKSANQWLSADKPETVANILSKPLKPCCSKQSKTD